MFSNLNLYREVVQKLILMYMYKYFYTDNKNKWKNNKLVFMWWTNLRLCYNLSRWSEDLDFAYIWKINEFSFTSMINFVVKNLRTHHFLDVEAKKNNKNTNVWKTFYVFSFTTVTNQKLKIKLEIDVKPPQWWLIIYNTIQNNVNFLPFIRPFSYNISTYNFDTTFMWKFGAILGRPYTKWRDIFDIWWYLNNLYLIQKLNFSYLNSVIEQINKHNNWEKIEEISFDNNGRTQFINLFTNKCSNIIRTRRQEIINDVSPFILDNWTKELFLTDLKIWTFLTKVNYLANLPIV